MSRNPSFSATIAGHLHRRGLTVSMARSLAAGLAGILLVVTLIALRAWEHQAVRSGLVFWIFAPPAWFVLEYQLWAHENAGPDPKEIAPRSRPERDQLPTIPFEELKYGQDLASKWWAAVVVLIGFFLTR